MTTHDFGDGEGEVPAHQHGNGGGWVADTAVVDDTVYIGPTAVVYGTPWVCHRAWVDSADSRSRIGTTVPQMRVLGVCEVLWASPVAQESIVRAPQ